MRYFLGLLVCHFGDFIEMHCGKIISVAIFSHQNLILTGLVDPIINKLGQYMHPGPGHKPIVFGVSRSKVKVTKVKFDFFQ